MRPHLARSLPGLVCGALLGTAVAAHANRLRFVVVGLVLAGTAAYAAQGDLDHSFGFNGVMDPVYFHQIRAAAALPHGDVAAVGTFSTTAPSPTVSWLWIAADGQHTTDCGLNTPFLAGFEGRAVLSDRNGNLVVGGEATIMGSESQQRAMIARYAAADPCNDLDTSWSDNGWQLLDPQGLCDTSDCPVVGIAESLAEFPRLFALVEVKVNLLASRYFVVAFFSNGDVNSGFGTDGYAEVTATGLGSLGAGGARLVIDPQGHPLVFVTRFDPDHSLDADAALLRFTTNGALDTSFESGGVAVPFDDPAVDEFARQLAIGADGAIYLGVDDITTPIGWMGERRPEGGWYERGFAGVTVAGLAPQGDGRVLILSSSTTDDAFSIVTKKLIDGSFDSDPGSWIHSYDVDFGGGNHQDPIALLLSGGRPLVLGNADTPASGEATFAIRALQNYIDADGFESGSTAFWSGKH